MVNYTPKDLGLVLHNCLENDTDFIVNCLQFLVKQQDFHKLAMGLVNSVDYEMFDISDYNDDLRNYLYDIGLSDDLIESYVDGAFNMVQQLRMLKRSKEILSKK